jgi:rubrerythrin
MDIGAIFFTLAVVTLVGMYVGQPYLQRRGRRTTQEDHEYSTLMADYDRTVNTLQELDFDNALGKVPMEDYPRQRAELLVKGAELLRKLDELAPSSSPGGSTNEAKGEGKDAESRIEAAVATRRADASANKAVTALEDDDLESLIASRRKTRNGKSAGFCPKCGKPILVSDRFCPSCGKAIN